MLSHTAPGFPAGSERTSYNGTSSLSARARLYASTQNGGVTASTGLLAAERHAGVWTPVIAHKTISANNNMALAA